MVFPQGLISALETCQLDWFVTQKTSLGRWVAGSITEGPFHRLVPVPCHLLTI